MYGAIVMMAQIMMFDSFLFITKRDGMLGEQIRKHTGGINFNTNNFFIIVMSLQLGDPG